MNKKIIAIDDENAILKDYQMILSSPEDDFETKQLASVAAELETELFGESADSDMLFRENYQLEVATQGEQGFNMIKDARENGQPFAMAFIDIRMPPGWDGLQTSKKIREIDTDIEIVIVTAYSDRERSEIIEKVGSPEKLLYLKKPFDPDEIRQLALCLTRKWDLEQKAQRHCLYLERLLGSVSRLKTLSISSVREVMMAILNEVLSFVNAKRGLIANLSNEKIIVEIVSDQFETAKIDELKTALMPNIKDIDSITWMQKAMILPLKCNKANLFLLVTDLSGRIEEEKLNLLKLLLETSCEVIENVKKQEQYIKNERIATIGQIAAGIIHEINNPLTAILGASEMYSLKGDQMWHLFEEFQKSLEEPTVPENIKQKLTELNSRFDPGKIRQKMTDHHSIISNGAERVRSLMGNIRSFSKSNNLVIPVLADLSEALENTLLLATNALKYGIKVHKQWDKPLIAKCDINSLKQVFLNLVLNAAQAMKGVGELWITGVKEENLVRISIKDSGPGIANQDLEKIFDAFYTTKEDGTGLGLSIVKGIIEKHQGKIWVESDIGQGTTFFIEIPL